MAGSVQEKIESVEMINTDDLLGKPFKKGGSGKDGYDCYTLSREVCRRAGIYLPIKETQILAAIENIEDRSNAINTGKEEDYVKLEKPEPFCVVTFSLRHPFVNHMGVMLDKHYFIHIMEKRSVVIERIDHKFWENRIEGFYKYVAGNTKEDER